MQLIQPKVKLLAENSSYHELVRKVETGARICYKSQSGSLFMAEELITKCISRGHESVLEHGSISLMFTTDRGVSHEAVRHRLTVFDDYFVGRSNETIFPAISQESTRYVKYSGDMEFVEPYWYKGATDIQRDDYILLLLTSEETYKSLIESGLPPQAARAVLPNSLATQWVMTANIREWRTIFKLRCAKDAHPDMRNVMLIALNECKNAYPVFFKCIEE